MKRPFPLNVARVNGRTRETRKQGMRGGELGWIERHAQDICKRFEISQVASKGGESIIRRSVRRHIDDCFPEH